MLSLPKTVSECIGDDGVPSMKALCVQRTLSQGDRTVEVGVSASE